MRLRVHCLQNPVDEWRALEVDQCQHREKYDDLHELDHVRQSGVCQVRQDHHEPGDCDGGADAISDALDQ